MDDSDECCSGRSSGCLKVAEEPHPCPYAEEINNDGDSLCNCCEQCEHECRMDI